MGWGGSGGILGETKNLAGRIEMRGRYELEKLHLMQRHMKSGERFESDEIFSSESAARDILPTPLPAFTSLHDKQLLHVSNQEDPDS